MANLHGPMPVTAGPDVRDLAQALGHTHETWQAAGHQFNPYSGCFTQNPYVVLMPPPPRVVAASAPATPKESAALGPDGCFVINSRADVMLRSWCAPIAAGSRAQHLPLLVIGQSIWPVVTKALRQVRGLAAPYESRFLSFSLCSDASPLRGVWGTVSPTSCMHTRRTTNASLSPSCRAATKNSWPSVSTRPAPA